METTEKNWGAEEGRAPDIEPNEIILFSECGRVLNKVCYRSHYFRIVKSEYGSISLLVKHGGGQERITEWLLSKILAALEILDSDNRYLLMYAVYQSWREGKREGVEKTSTHYRQAFVEGRLRKRKLPKLSAVKVWIEDRKQEVSQ